MVLWFWKRDSKVSLCFITRYGVRIHSVTNAHSAGWTLPDGPLAIVTLFSLNWRCCVFENDVNVTQIRNLIVLFIKNTMLAEIKLLGWRDTTGGCWWCCSCWRDTGLRGNNYSRENKIIIIGRVTIVSWIDARVIGNRNLIINLWLWME